MKLNKWTVGLVVAGVVSSPLIASAWPKFIKQVARVVTAPVVEPIKQAVVVGKVVTGQQSPGEAISNIKDDKVATVKAAGGVTEESAKAVATVHQEAANKLTDAAKTVAGKPGEVIADVLTVSHRLQNEASATAVGTAGRIAQGKNVGEIVSAPLAAAIRSAREQHKLNARPIPDQIKARLVKFIPTQVLEKAKYVIGNPHLSLPSGINLVQTFTGGKHAVTVDDIIVFSEEPGNSLWWWGHEVQHVVQYDRLGVDEFARKYIFDHGDIEKEADEVGDRVVQANLVAR